MTFNTGNSYRQILKAALLAGLAANAFPVFAQQAGGPTGDPQFSNPLQDLFPRQDYVDANGVDLSNGKLRVRGDLISTNADRLNVGVNFVSPGFAITPTHLTSDPPLSISNSLGQLVYVSLTTHSILAWQQEDDNREYPLTFVNFSSPDDHDGFVNIGTTFYNSANTSASIVPSGTGYQYTSKDGETADLSSDLIYLQLYAPRAPGSVYHGNIVTKLTRPDGEVWTYNYDKASFRYVADGFIFNSSRIRSIVSNRGYALQFSYQRDAPFQDGPAQVDQWYSITRIVKYDKARAYCDETSAARCASFAGGPQTVDITYDRTGNQVRMAKSNGESLEFGFSVEPRWGAWRIVSTEKGDIVTTKRVITYREYPLITYPSGSIPNPLTWFDNVQSVSAGGQNWNYELSGIHYEGLLDSSSAMRATEPGAFVRSLSMALSQDPPTTVTDALSRTTSFTFFRYPWESIVKGTLPNPGGSLRPNEAIAYPSTEILPEDASTSVKSLEFFYDDRGNRTTARRSPKAGSGLAPIDWTAFYPTCGNLKVCNKPLTITDPRSGTTSYTYDATHGSMVSEMKPAPVAGAPRPLKLYSYVQKYAYILNSGGSLVQAASPIWVPGSMTECQTMPGSSTPTCDGSAPQRVTTYEYGADATVDNLLVRGIAVTANGQTLRTCFGYDGQGNKVTVTRPRAALSICQ